MGYRTAMDVRLVDVARIPVVLTQQVVDLSHPPFV